MSDTAGVKTPRREPKQARARERLGRILSATRAELEDRPVSEITMEAIAARAGVPVGSLYQFYGGKTALLVEVAATIMGEADGIMALKLSECLTLPWREAVDQVLDASLGILRDSPQYRRIVQSMRYTAEFADVTAESNRRVADLMSLHPAFTRAGLSREKALEICTTTVVAVNALQDRMLADENLDFDACMSEAKRMVKGYFASYVD